MKPAEFSTFALSPFSTACRVESFKCDSENARAKEMESVRIQPKTPLNESMWRRNDISKTEADTEMCKKINRIEIK